MSCTPKKDSLNVKYNIVFSKKTAKLERSKFKKLVKDKQTDKYNKGFDSCNHLVSMLFCHFARSKSVRDISNGLRFATGDLNHLGIDKAPSKSSVSYQNKNRTHELFKEYYFMLLQSFGQHPKFRIKSKILLLDSTTISLCLSIFDWAKYKTNKGAVIMHTLLDFDGNLPAYINITDGKTADNKGAYDIPLLKGSVILADRFYNDFSLLNIWDSKQLHFVIRHKDNLRFETIKELELPENRLQHVLKDEIIILTNTKLSQVYSSKLRRVAVWDTENEQVIELITNQFTWTANTISELYKSRWMVEIFFRNFKQLLHIKSFVGTSENGERIQIWTALSTILILKALRAQAKFGWHLSNLVAFIRLDLFVKIELEKWLNNPLNEVEKPPPELLQGGLF